MFFERQVTAGTIFDEILVTDSLEEAQKFAEDTWAAKKDKEKEAHEELKKKKKEEEEVSRRAVEINPLQIVSSFVCERFGLAQTFRCLLLWTLRGRRRRVEKGGRL